MGRKIGWVALSILLLTVLLIPSAPAQDAKITVMNPLGIQPPIRLIPMPERAIWKGRLFISSIRNMQTPNRLSMSSTRFCRNGIPKRPGC